jgi:glycosyltransferase involved in cell wall biosynthesis
MSIREAKATRFEYFPSQKEMYEPGMPVLSVIIDCYYGLDLVKQSVQSVIDQDYPNVELILVNNGAQQDVSEYLLDIHNRTKNVPLIKFDENQFDWNDTEKIVTICWNAALIHSKGEYVSHLAYDDKLSENYATRMIQLFVGNPDCVTAAPLAVTIDENGNIIGSPEEHMLGNTRGRYTDGVRLAVDLIHGKPEKLFAAPGELLVIKKTLLMQLGGYDRIIDLSQVLKYAIQGISGFDAEANVFWRKHDAQLNKIAKRRGIIWYSTSEKAWRESGIIKIWEQRFDTSMVRALLAYKRKVASDTPLHIIRENVSQKNIGGVFSALLNVVRECPFLLPRALYALVAQATLILSGKFSRLGRAFVGGDNESRP